jgi:hypothetical protein
MKPRVGSSDLIRGGTIVSGSVVAVTSGTLPLSEPDPNPPCLRRLLIGLYTTVAAQREARRSR